MPIVKPGRDPLLSGNGNGILSPTQYGFRKGKGTRDCLAMLTTDISTSFEMKKLFEYNQNLLTILLFTKTN
jgi:hypothetical protein